MVSALYNSFASNIMGGGSSVPRRPANYPEEDWQSILSLFDALDSNSNFVVDGNDNILPIAMRLHVARINLLDSKRAQKISSAKTLEDERRREFECEMELWRKTLHESIAKDLKEIRRLREMESDAIKQSFLKEVAPNGSTITFDRFFQYAKDKVKLLVARRGSEAGSVRSRRSSSVARTTSDPACQRRLSATGRQPLQKKLSRHEQRVPGFVVGRSQLQPCA